MKKQIVLLRFAAILFASTPFVLPAADQRATLEAARKDYQVNVARIEADRKLQLESATAQYLQSLETLLNQCMDERKLEDATAVKAEMDRVRFGSAVAVTADDLKRGLVLHFSFDEAETSGKVTDRSGTGNHGQAVGARWTAQGKRGGGFEFGPVEHYIGVPNHESLNPRQLTLAAWIKTTRKDKFWRRIFDKSYDKGYALSMAGDYQGKTWQGQVGLEINTHWNASGVPVADGRWHHVAATFDGAEQRLYMDGQQAGNPTRWRGEPTRNAHDLTIGLARSTPEEGADFGKASFDGSMDDLMVFSRALSAKEVRALFDSQK